MLLLNSNILSLRDGLQALFRRRTLILFIFILTVVPVGIATITAPKTYRATAKVLVRREDRLGALNPYYSRLNQEEDIRSELEIASSRPVLENVLRAGWSHGRHLDNLDSVMYQGLAPAERQPDSANKDAMVEKALDRLRRHLTVEAVTGANVIEIGFEDRDPERAAWFANSLANAYAAYNAQVRGGGGAENFLEERIEAARSRLDSLEKALYAYRTSTGLVVDERQQAIIFEKYRVADQQLAQLRERAEVLAGKVARLRQARTTGDSLIIPTAEMDAHPSVRLLYSKLTELRLERNALVEKYKSDHRLVADLDKQIRGVQTELVAEVDRLLALEDERLKSLRQEGRVLSKTAANVRWNIKSLPKKERVLNELDLAIDNARKIYSLLVMRREEMSVENATDRRLSRITIISLAGVPYEPISPRPGRNITLGLILGALAGLAGGLAREYFDGTFKSPQEVSLVLQVPILGAISAKSENHTLKF
jgi:uncharacterized protein involved in exopolysaccharide biosynthesis